MYNFSFPLQLESQIILIWNIS